MRSSLVGIRIIDEASHAMATLIVTLFIKIGFTLLDELGSVINLLIGIVDQTAHTMTTIVVTAANVVGSRVLPVLFVVIRHPLNDGAQHHASRDRADIVAAMVVNARIGVERVTATMMVTADIGEYTRTALGN